MGELLLCNEPLAKNPYFIEEVSWNIYSMEELCYFIETNTYLLDKKFMSEELCRWIRDEVKHVSLAENLFQLIKQNGRITDFAYLILWESGYCSKETVKQIVDLLKSMEKKTNFEQIKMRADHLMRMGNYLKSISEYKFLLDSKAAISQPKGLLGNIWHNLGTAYAQLFIFDEAANCYEKAFQRNREEESLKACLLCYGIMNKEAEFFQIVQEYEVSERLLDKVKEAIYLAATSEQMQDSQEKVMTLFDFSETEIHAKDRSEMTEAISDWKEGYRKKTCLF